MKKKLLLSCLTILVILTTISSLLLNTYAATQSQKDELQDKINQAKENLNDITDNKSEAQSELENLTNQVTQVQNEIASLKSQLEEVNAQIEVKETEIAEKEAEIEEKDQLLRKRLVALYKLGDTSYLDVLFDSEDIFDFLSRYSMIQRIADNDTDLMNELEQKKQVLQNDKAELEENKAKVQELKAEQEVKSAELKVLQENKQAEVDKLSEEEKAVQADIDAYNAAMVQLNKELEEAAKDAQDKINSSNNGNGLKFDGSFIWPCDNKIVTSRMKYRWGRWHKGIDIGASYENVYAAASGYAYKEVNPGGYGNYIMVFHGNGYVTLYGHLNSYNISNGQYVSQGQVIATSGNTGASYGAHLHFEIRKATSFSDFFGDNWYDPLDYLPGGYTLSSGA